MRTFAATVSTFSKLVHAWDENPIRNAKNETRRLLDSHAPVAGAVVDQLGAFKGVAASAC
jgi:hypothetical protein